MDVSVWWIVLTELRSRLSLTRGSRTDGSFFPTVTVTEWLPHCQCIKRRKNLDKSKFKSLSPQHGGTWGSQVPKIQTMPLLFFFRFFFLIDLIVTSLNRSKVARRHICHSHRLQVQIPGPVPVCVCFLHVLRAPVCLPSRFSGFLPHSNQVHWRLQIARRCDCDCKRFLLCVIMWPSGNCSTLPSPSGGWDRLLWSSREIWTVCSEKPIFSFPGWLRKNVKDSLKYKNQRFVLA